MWIHCGYCGHEFEVDDDVINNRLPVTCPKCDRILKTFTNYEKLDDRLISWGY